MQGRATWEVEDGSEKEGEAGDRDVKGRQGEEEDEEDLAREVSQHRRVTRYAARDGGRPRLAAALARGDDPAPLATAPIRRLTRQHERLPNRVVRTVRVADAVAASLACASARAPSATAIEEAGMTAKPPQLAISTGRPARFHSGKPMSNLRAFKPFDRSSRTASSA